MKRTLFLLGSLAFAQSSLEPPLAGIVRGADNRIRRIHGVAGNFLAPRPGGEEALGFASSGRFALRKTDGEILVLDAGGSVTRRLRAPGGPALFAFDAAGEPALAWFPDSREMWRLAPFERVAFESGVPVFSIAVGEGGSIRVNDFAIEGYAAPARVQQMSERLFHLLLDDGRSLCVRTGAGAGAWELPEAAR